MSHSKATFLNTERHPVASIIAPSSSCSGKDQFFLFWEASLQAIPPGLPVTPGVLNPPT